MFTRRPVFYHPYNKPSTPLSPAGFKIADYLKPKRCFNLFQGPNFDHARSPDPSPLSSPIRGATYPDDDAPPTLCVADLFVNNGFLPQRPSTPPSDRPRDGFQNLTRDNVRPQPPMPMPMPSPRKRKHGPKHLSFTKGVPRRRRPQQLKGKRDAARQRMLDPHERRVARAREGMRNLEREAETLMRPEHMTAQDKVFLKELRRLGMQLSLEDDLERCRKHVARAAAETGQRREEHEKRDEEAAKMWDESQDEAALEEQLRKVEAFVRGEEEQTEAHFRRMEEDAMRADEERRRAHEEWERRVQEEQERHFRQEQARKAEEEEERLQRERRREEQERRQRAEQERRQWEQQERQRREERERRRREEQEHRLREELERRQRVDKERRLREEIAELLKDARERQERERQLREEIERLLRETHERCLHVERERLAREERERQARATDEQAHRAAEEEQVRRHFALYEAKWNELRTSNAIPPIDVREMPWPVFGVVSSPEQITDQDVRTFLFHPLRPGVGAKSARDKVKSEVLRFHPDKFNSRVVPKIQQFQQAVAQEIAGVVARILTRIMTEEVEKN